MKHPRIRILLDTYAPLLVKNKRTQEAVDLWKEYLDAQQTRFGDTDPITYDNLTSFMRFQLSVGDANGALETITKIESGIEPLVFKEKNEILAFALRKHAGILYDQNTNSELAVKLASQSLELCQADAKLSRNGSFDWFRAHVTLARAYLQDGQLDRALELFNAAEKMIPAFSGKDRLYLKDDIQYEKANWFLRSGDLPSAIACCEKRLEYAKVDADLFPDIARGFILCAEHGQGVGADASIVEPCFSQAVEALSKALQKGKITIEVLKKSKRFAKLSDRDDFKTLVEGKDSTK
jgi:tetratricopeptide (TPR) repeat protein